MIPVTRPFLPPHPEVHARLDQVLESGWITNNGPQLRSLEGRLRTQLDVPWLHIVSNGTIAIQLALRALNLRGKIATTPFSYVATTSSLLWEQCEPVFVDIDPHTLNIDAAKVAAIEGQIDGVLATHVFGIPCDVDALDQISHRAGVPVVYDAAHAFGVSYKGRSLLSYGTLSTLSFHATKLFHMVEGGAVVGADPALQRRIERLRNFGQAQQDGFVELGINGKNSELHAAMGHCVLDHVEEIITQRRAQVAFYQAQLAHTVRFPSLPPGTEWNAAYAPVLFESEALLLEALSRMQAAQIFPRRYFRPALNTLGFVGEGPPMPIAEDVAHRVLCLPLFHDLTRAQQVRVCELIQP